MIEIARAVLSGRMLVAAIMGFASGLPLLLTGSVLQAWMKDEGVDLGTIGLFALVGLPYTLKFLWAPLMDRFTPNGLGRRRGWLLIYQLALIGSLLVLSVAQPANRDLASHQGAMSFFPSDLIALPFPTDGPVSLDHPPFFPA